MYSYEYPHPALTTDCVVFGFDGSGLNLLLVERGLKPYKGKWALPGGFVRIDETLEEGALRELREETGVMDIYIEQLQAFSRVDRDPRERVVTVAFLAFVRQEGYEVIAGDDAAKAQWFPVPYRGRRAGSVGEGQRHRLQERDAGLWPAAYAGADAHAGRHVLV